MPYNPDIHHRRSIRLKEYDYSRSGAYYVTVCARNRECLFGEIIDGQMILNETGKIADAEWRQLHNRFYGIDTSVFQIMPNHIHGIIVVGATLAVAQTRAGATRAGASPAPTVGEIVGAYKSLVANGCRKLYDEKNEILGTLWQRNYYERIIRSDDEYRRIAEYIINNPANWEKDALRNNI
jgi:REP element-mobilizing transposase RayT